MTLYQVQVRVLESRYEDDVYLVTVLKPEGVGDLINEYGAFLECGKFSFDSTEEIAVNTEPRSRDYGSGATERFVDSRVARNSNIEKLTTHPGVYQDGSFLRFYGTLPTPEGRQITYCSGPISVMGGWLSIEDYWQPQLLFPKRLLSDVERRQWISIDTAAGFRGPQVKRIGNMGVNFHQTRIEMSGGESKNVG